MPRQNPTIQSLVWATDVDVLALDRQLERRSDHWVVRSPSNPTFWWGNFLLFDEAPVAGDGERWMAQFGQAFGDGPEMTHVTLAWDRTDGEIGAAEAELVSAGFELEVTVGLTAAPQEILTHSRASTEVEVMTLDPAPGRDADRWDQVLELQFAQAPSGSSDDYHRNFLATRQQGLRERFAAGHGFWYVAVHEARVVASLGIVVTDGRARYQTVDTAEPFRRRGIATRLVADAAHHAASHHEIHSFVIAADPDYHAIGIYESLGFKRTERVTGALRKPPKLPAS